MILPNGNPAFPNQQTRDDGGHAFDEIELNAQEEGETVRMGNTDWLISGTRRIVEETSEEMEVDEESEDEDMNLDVDESDVEELFSNGSVSLNTDRDKSIRRTLVEPTKSKIILNASLLDAYLNKNYDMNYVLSSTKESREDTFQMKMAGQTHMNLEFDEDPIEMILKKPEGKQMYNLYIRSISQLPTYVEVMDVIGKEHKPEKLVQGVVRKFRVRSSYVEDLTCGRAYSWQFFHNGGLFNVRRITLKNHITTEKKCKLEQLFDDAVRDRVAYEKFQTKNDNEDEEMPEAKQSRLDSTSQEKKEAELKSKLERAMGAHK